MEIIKRLFTFLLDSFQAILLVISFFLFIYVFIWQPHQVSGISMFPTFHDQDLLLSNLLAVKQGKIVRGDVIVFHSPVEDEKLYIKRVIGLPGDTVSIANGKVYLNGALLDESSYLQPEVLTYGETAMRDGESVYVPEASYFVMGDNRPHSADSREWGPLKELNVVGRSMLRFWPLKDFEIIHNPFTRK